MFNKPILLIIFNRPEKTRRVLDAIRLARPSKLFIAADGPRTPEEKALCDETRAVVSNIDWPCEVSTRFQEHNMGCKDHPSSAITWLFSHVEDGIIFEDDCLPSSDFFAFAASKLDEFKNDESVMQIAGSIFEGVSYPVSEAFVRSRLSHIWGWATWKRSWQKFDGNMEGLEAFIKKNKIAALFERKDVQRYWIKLFKHNRNKPDVWDAQWQFTLMDNDGWSISPTRNLIENIGFGKDATHTIEKMAPKFVDESSSLDLDTRITLTRIEPFYKKVLRKLKLS